MKYLKYKLIETEYRTVIANDGGGEMGSCCSLGIIRVIKDEKFIDL